jgi:hypothetical protein
MMARIHLANQEAGSREFEGEMGSSRAELMSKE